MTRSILICGVLFFWVSNFGWSADFCQGPQSSDPGSFNPVSVDSSIRKTQARIQNWQEDLKLVKGKGNSACVKATFERLVFGAATQPSFDLGLELVEGELRAFGSEPQPIEVLQKSLDYVHRFVPFNPKEAEFYEKVTRRNSNVNDCAGQIRATINVQLLYISTITRLYEERVNWHSAHFGYWNDNQHECVLLKVQVQRDERMLVNEQHVLDLYHRLMEEMMRLQRLL